MNLGKIINDDIYSDLFLNLTIDSRILENKKLLSLFIETGKLKKSFTYFFDHYADGYISQYKVKKILSSNDGVVVITKDKKFYRMYCDIGHDYLIKPRRDKLEIDGEIENIFKDNYSRYGYIFTDTNNLYIISNATFELKYLENVLKLDKKIKDISNLHILFVDGTVYDLEKNETVNTPINDK